MLPDYYRYIKGKSGECVFRDLFFDIKKRGDIPNLSLRDVSTIFNIPYNTICQWFTGKRKAPEYVLDMIKYICDN